MCKPNKTGGSTRWSPHEFQDRKLSEKEILEAKRK